jgi:CRP/FNR family transcriptional regulator
MVKKASMQATETALASVPYFAGLDDELLAAIAAITALHHYQEGEIVFLEGEPCRGLYIVQSGWLKGLIASPGGREQIIRLLGPGDAFNEHGVLTKEGTNLVTVQVVEESSIWVVDRSSLLSLMDQYPVLTRAVMQHLASRVVHLMKLVEDLSLRSVEARLARLLLEQPKLESERHRWVTQAEMAARLGTVVDVVNRALHKLEAEGLIRIVRHRIEIVNRLRLEQKAETRE